MKYILPYLSIPKREGSTIVGIQLNVPNNYHSANHWVDDDTYFDELIYQQQYTVERTKAWMDSYRTRLIRHDTSIGNWTSWHHLFCIQHWVEQLKTLNNTNFNNNVRIRLLGKEKGYAD